MKLEKVVLATANRGKVREIEMILDEFGILSKSLEELGIAASAREEGRSYRENAFAKARAVVPHAGGFAVLAEDSGLEVEALEGRPGVRSARYGGAGASDAARIGALLAELREVPQGKRGAEFCCVAVAVLPDGREFEASGRVRGLILPSPRGRMGFGYDPVFFYPPLGRSFAELEAEEKNRVSHRALAFRALIGKIASG